MKKTLLALGIVIGLAVVAVLPLDPSRIETLSPIAETKPESTAANHPIPGQAAPAPSTIGGHRSPATLYPPSLTEVRDEVARDPHSTPASIIRFAQSLAPEMETALSDEDAARHLQTKLGQCAKESEIDSTAALCLVNSKRLADRHPSLRPEHALLESNVRPIVASLQRSIALATQ